MVIYIMNKEVYCSNCKTDSSTEPTFNCIVCCCKKCKYKKCECLNKVVCKVTSSQTSSILLQNYCDKCNIYNTTEKCKECVWKNKAKTLYCINCHKYGSPEPNFICMICCCQKCSNKNTECNCIKYSSRPINDCNKGETLYKDLYKDYKDLFKDKKLCNGCNNSQPVSTWYKKRDCCYNCYKNIYCHCFLMKWRDCIECESGEFGI